MLLVFDIGNSNVTIGLYADITPGTPLLDSWRIHTDPRLTGDDLYLATEGFLGERVHDVIGVAALSTVPSLLREVRFMLPRYFGKCQSIVVEPGVRTGIPLKVDNPKSVGTDRVVNAVAAYQLCQSACVVVDVGTTTVVDAVSSQGEFLGGAIAPGMAVSVHALAQSAAALPSVELTTPKSVLGKTTVESLQSGILFGFAGQVDGLVNRIRDVLQTQSPSDSSQEIPVIITGGLAPLLLDLVTISHDYKPALTMDGLRLVFARSAR